MLYDKITSKVGNTPLIKWNDIYLKMEMYNPSGSIKDRPAYNILINLFNDNIIKEGDTIICPTSGNMGISLAYFSKYFSIKVIIVLPDNSSKERISILESYNVEIIYSKGIEGMKGSMKLAKDIAKKNNYYYFDQFSLEHNYTAYYYLAEEIIKQIPDVDTIICGIGTGGTYIGLCKYIKENKLDIKVIGYEPSNVALISNKLFNLNLKIDNGKIGIPGTGSTEISNIVLNNLQFVDTIRVVNPVKVREFWSKLVNNNLHIGISGAASIYLALQEEGLNRKIVSIIPDGLNRYSSDIND